MGKLFKSIQTKITIWFVVVSLIPLIFSSVFTYNQTAERLNEKEKESMQSLVDSKAQGMDEWLDRRKAQIELAAKTEILQSAEPKRINPYLKQIEEQTSVYEGVGFAQKGGTVTASSAKDTIGLNITDRSYFQSGMLGKSSYSEILTSKTTGNRIIVVASPVKDARGIVIGLMYATVNFESLINNFSLSQTAEQDQVTNMEVMLVDEQSRFQVARDDKLIGTKVEQAGVDESLTTLLNLKSKDSTTNIYTQNGEEYLLAYSPINETGYGLYFSIPMSSVLAGAKSVQNSMIIVMVITAILIVFLSIFISGSIAKPIRIVSEQLKRVAQGDLSDANKKIKNKDEVGELWLNLQDMITNLRSLMSNVASVSEQVAAASQQISATTEEISGGSMNQANSAQIMSQLVKELTNAIESVAESAEEASELSNQTERIAQEGGKVVTESIEGMTSVNEQMSRLELDSNKIGDIIEVIDDIAEQTNLLALNAAIEAARAGDQGRGFAVVADEVRKLAERSGDATKQITEIIKGMQNNTGLSVKSVSQAVKKTAKISEAFDSIVRMVNHSTEKVHEIAAASEEQAAQSKEVLNSIVTISAASEEAAAASQETAATTQSLARLAEDLNEAISIFKLNKSVE
ncbi:methyl-accepting chemotaxis protein [Paenibacillus sp. FSL F4-0125]|uniref:methyl-accepting chemotaxis protein n=1 Tax=Paenibacillus sp. FSL F4-0125 TaxID=2954730 RepID=UPI0030FC8F79